MKSAKKHGSAKRIGLRQAGQGMMEYIIIVALIAVAAIGVYSAFGKTVRAQTAGLSKELAGQNSSKQIETAGKAAEEGAKRADATKGLGNYNADNDQSGGSDK